ncbi:MAG: S8 family serine peptidase [Verrucomicrobiia bacterium]
MKLGIAQPVWYLFCWACVKSTTTIAGLAASCLTLLASVNLTAQIAPSAVDQWAQKVDPWVFDSSVATSNGYTEFVIFLNEQADLSAAASLKTKLEKGEFVYRKLTETARQTQAPILADLTAQGASHQPFWVANMIWVRGDLSLVQRMAARADVKRVCANPTVYVPEPTAPVTRAPLSVSSGVEWNISKVHATEAWSLGYTGQTVVVAGQDTGYQWNHPALINHYRGYDGVSTNHNYNWHDAIHSNDVHNSGTNPCGYNLLAPCDDNGHGTHTVGTMVGDDGAGNQIGMAPGAKWIGCRNMERGWGSPASYSECFQWFIAPTDLNGNNPDPSKAPDVINNSWYCPAEEGCTSPEMLQTVVDNTRAAGIVVVVSAGNSGLSGCSSVSEEPAIYDASLSVGATDSSDNIANFSSRGPVTVDGSNRLKPNLSAPGVNVRSSYPTSTYAVLSGTSMAGPHVAGAVALLISAHPELRGQPDTIQSLLQQLATPLTNSEVCGGLAAANVPNNTFGWGRLDALASLGLADSDGDGMINYSEILAGTNLRDSSSVLRITTITRNNFDLLVTFSSVTNRSYRLERTDDLTSGAWTTVTNNISGTGAPLTLADPAATATNSQFFYRIRLQQ